MKKISLTWKHQKTLSGAKAETSYDSVSSDNANTSGVSGRKRLGRVAINTTSSHQNHHRQPSHRLTGTGEKDATVPAVSHIHLDARESHTEDADPVLSLSFATELDADYITAVNQIEHDFHSHEALKSTELNQKSTKTSASANAKASPGTNSDCKTPNRSAKIRNTQHASFSSTRHQQNLANKRSRNMVTPSPRAKTQSRQNKSLTVSTPTQSPAHKKRKDKDGTSSSSATGSSSKQSEEKECSPEDNSCSNILRTRAECRKAGVHGTPNKSGFVQTQMKANEMGFLKVGTERETTTSKPQSCASSQREGMHVRSPDKPEGHQSSEKDSTAGRLLLDSQSPLNLSSRKESPRLCSNSSSPPRRQRSRVRPSKQSTPYRTSVRKSSAKKVHKAGSNKGDRRCRDSSSDEKAGKRGKFTDAARDGEKPVADTDRLDSSYVSVYLESQSELPCSSSDDEACVENDEVPGSKEAEEKESVESQQKTATEPASAACQRLGGDADQLQNSTAVNCNKDDAEWAEVMLQAAVAESLLLSDWGLPEAVLSQYHHLGITHMFPWQAQCLRSPGVLEGGNLIYSAPTSAGKTLVAELLVLKRVLETRQKALIILPFVSVAREKMFSLQALFQDAGVRVGGFMGSHRPPGGLSALDVAVCTIEKGNSLLNRMLEEGSLDKLGVVVVDELHMVGDSHRGYLLELFLTKICYMAHRAGTLARRAGKEGAVGKPVQIIGMSATLPNLDLLAQWLGAALYRTDFRPVPLTECVKVGTAVFDANMNKLREIDSNLMVKSDEDHIVPLCLETVLSGCSVLIFCPTKARCEKLAENIAREFYNISKTPRVQTSDKGFVKASEILRIPLDSLQLREVVEQLRRTPVGLDRALGRSIGYGVAHHHAGLTFDERDIVEGAFRQGYVKVLVATSTLSSGVNLPARRVIIRTPTFHGRIIDTLVYKQMSGRAGRKGVDTKGESILVCKPNEKAKAKTLLTSDLPPVHSCLVRHGNEALSSSLKRAVLEVIVSGVVTTPDEVVSYLSCTLLSASLACNDAQKAELIQACIDFLRSNEFVSLRPMEDGKGEERFFPSQLGEAVLASSLSPDEGLIIFADLQKARQCFVLENELHIIYLVTPIYAQDISSGLDWFGFYHLWECLPVDMRRVAELVGVCEAFIARAIRGRLPTSSAEGLRRLAVHRRFYTALVLMDLVREVPLLDVARKYNCSKGQLQALQQSAATFAGMVTVFCARLGWSNLELLLSQFQSRLTFGVQRELCDLVRLSALNGQRARALYNAGYPSVAALATADVADVENVLKSASPFQSCRQQEGESEADVAMRQRSRCVWLAGRQALTEREAAAAIIEEAKQLIQEELGGLHVHWGSKVKSQGHESSGSRVSGGGNGDRDSSARTSPPLDNGGEEKRRASAVSACDTPAPHKVKVKSRSRSGRRLTAAGKKTPSPLTDVARRRSRSLTGVSGRRTASSAVLSPSTGGIGEGSGSREQSSISILVPPELTSSKRSPMSACRAEPILEPRCAWPLQTPQSRRSRGTPQLDEVVNVAVDGESDSTRTSSKTSSEDAGKQADGRASNENARLDERNLNTSKACQSAVLAASHILKAASSVAAESADADRSDSRLACRSTCQTAVGATPSDTLPVHGVSRGQEQRNPVACDQSENTRASSSRTKSNPATEKVSNGDTGDATFTLHITEKVCSFGKGGSEVGANRPTVFASQTSQPAEEGNLSGFSASIKKTAAGVSSRDGVKESAAEFLVSDPLVQEAVSGMPDTACDRICDDEFFADSFVLNTQIINLMTGEGRSDTNYPGKTSPGESRSVQKNALSPLEGVSSNGSELVGQSKVSLAVRQSPKFLTDTDCRDDPKWNVPVYFGGAVDDDFSPELMASGSLDCFRNPEEGFLDTSGVFDPNASYNQLEIRTNNCAVIPVETAKDDRGREKNIDEKNEQPSIPAKSAPHDRAVSVEKEQRHRRTTPAPFDDKELQEDLNIALNMSDSFSSFSFRSADGILSPEPDSPEDRNLRASLSDADSAQFPAACPHPPVAQAVTPSAKRTATLSGKGEKDPAPSHPTVTDPKPVLHKQAMPPVPPLTSDAPAAQNDRGPGLSVVMSSHRGVPNASASTETPDQELSLSESPDAASPIAPLSTRARMSSTPNSAAPCQLSVLSDSLSASVVEKIFMEVERVGTLSDSGKDRACPPVAEDAPRERGQNGSEDCAGDGLAGRKQLAMETDERDSTEKCHGIVTRSEYAEKTKVRTRKASASPPSPPAAAAAAAAAETSAAVALPAEVSPNISSGSDCVPPTPPDDSSTVMSPCLRRTPSRACKERAQKTMVGTGRKASQTSSSKSSSSVDSSHGGNPPGKPEGRDAKGSGTTTGSEKSCARAKKCGKSGGFKDESQRGNQQIGILSGRSSDKTSAPNPVTFGGLKNDCERTNLLENDAGGRDRCAVKGSQTQGTAVGAGGSTDRCKVGTIDSQTHGKLSQSGSFCDSQASLTIIDVCADARLWETFLKEWRGQRQFSIAVACDKPPPAPVPITTIGGKFARDGVRQQQAVEAQDSESDVPLVTGLSVCWEGYDAYYIHLAETQEEGDPDDSLAPAPLDVSLSAHRRLAAVRSLLEASQAVQVAAFDVKAQYLALAWACGVAPRCQWQDPKLALWLQDPGAREAGFHRMVKDFLPGDVPLLEGIGGGIGLSSLGLTAGNPGSGRHRAAVDSVLCLRLMDSLTARLSDRGLLESFTDVEMPALLSLARMELNGFGFSEVECQSQRSLLSGKISALEEQAYRLAGHPFSLSAPDDIAQVLYVELGLPVNGDPQSAVAPKTLGPSRRALGRGRGKPKFSTAKEVLERLRAFHPLPALVLEWRRLSAALTRQVFPLHRQKTYNRRTGMERIFGECQFHTATGRVSMSEPNLQNIPNDFQITLPGIPVDRCDASALPNDVSTASPVAVSMRHAFVPFRGGVLLAADYSQLELRLIAHLSQDRRLIDVLNTDGDVFKLIASQWRRVSPEDVSPVQRQQAKQVCYGMLYGIGAKALGEQLQVDENDAGAFMETFKARYPEMRSYLRETVDSCRREGFVKTISGRRRYLPAIKDANPYARAQAERQAVNTTVQGSAADLVKSAMAAIDRQLEERFPDCRRPHRFHSKTDGTGRDVADVCDAQMPRGAYLVLQLHDELIYEINSQDLTWVARTVKNTMETVMDLKVRMPVKVKVGYSWGKLEDYDV